jgi:hypothetical protein
MPPKRADLRAVRQQVEVRSSSKQQQTAVSVPRLPTLSWPPTSQTVKLMFLYSTVSTLKPAREERDRCQSLCVQQREPACPRDSPMVGMVVTISPSFSL